MDRLNVCRRIDLADVKGIKRDALGQIAIRAVRRPRNVDRAKAQNHLGTTSGAAGNGRQVEKEVLGDGQAVEIGEQMAAGGQHTIGLGAHQQFDIGRSPRKGRIEIALAIGDDGDGGGAGLAQARRRLGTGQPAAGLFSSVVRVGACATGPCRSHSCTSSSPRMTPLSASTTSTGWMRKAGSTPFPAVPNAALLCLCCEKLISLVSWIANTRRPATCANRCDLASAIQLRFAHSLVAQKSPEGLFARFIAAEPFDRHRSAQHHASEQLLPLFRSRSSLNTPRSCATSIAASIEKTASQGITLALAAPPVPGKLSQHVAEMPMSKCVRSVAPTLPLSGGGSESEFAATFFAHPP